MKRTLIIVRHGIAEDKDDFQKKTGRPDSERPLTKIGKEKMKDISAWLQGQLDESVDLIIDSPLVRSQQTADILCDSIKHKKRHRLEELDPEVHPELLVHALEKLKWTQAIIVGHEGHLSHTLAYLMKSDPDKECPFKFKKGGIVHLTVNESLVDRNVTLNWQVTPKIVLSRDLNLQEVIV